MLIRAATHGLAQPTRALAARALDDAALLVDDLPLRELRERCADGSVDLVLLGSEADADLEALVGELGQGAPPPALIVVADCEDPERRAALLRAGCRAVIYAGLEPSSLRETLHALAVRTVDERAAASGEPSSFSLGDFASESQVMRECLDLARKTVDTDSTLLVLGETGTGKEWLARAIHAEGPRARAPFVAISCAALPDALIEAELFGHERGAFTGASRARRGYFELAHRGVLFLDEIGEVPLHVQVKLLRALEERRVQPVGSERAVEVDVRVMAATNRDLEQEIQGGRFRNDLFYRLNVVTLHLPPLRERRGDVPALVRSYVEEFRVRFHRPVRQVAREAMQALVRYGWPGNVRELINVVERAVLLSSGPEIGLDDLPRAVRESLPAPPPTSPAPERAGQGTELPASLDVPADLPTRELPLPPDWLNQPWREARRQLLDLAERHYLERLLAANQGRIGDSARRAGMDPRSLFEKLQRYGLRKERFRA